MLPKLPRVSGEQTIGVLQRFGFEVARQRGSHVILKSEFPKKKR
jgi:predicted RNA binding protein YcfA (HicA-like mRNA interferase family)